MAKYHVSTDGNPRVCTASEGKCPLGGNENHFTSKEAARAAFEESVATSESVSKKNQLRESIRTVNSLGDVYWRNSDGLFHRDGDLPAMELKDGSKRWYQNGKCHRDGGLPAMELADGTKLWYQNDKLHRDGDLHAIEWVNGTKEWWVNGEFQYRVRSDGTRTNYWF